MIKKTIKYTDFNGVDRDEDFLFHLSSHEVVRLQARLGKDDVQQAIKELVESNNMEEILSVLEYIILNSYGVKSPDGKTFIKTKEVKESFEYSQAYAELFEELLTNPNAVKEFASGISNTVKVQKEAPIKLFQPNTQEG